jgi:hypothetical protein
MSFFSFFQKNPSDRFMAKLKKATLPDSYINSDSLPSESHLRLIHEIAEDCLNDFSRTNEMLDYIDAHPLLGLEVTDEILVLVKNDPDKYSSGPPGLMFAPLYAKLNRTVEALRGGRRRMTTTPTLRGGGKRGRG